MFRKQLSRVYELRDQIENPDSPSAYFHNFDNSLRDEPLKMQAFLAVEKELKELDSTAWQSLKKEVSLYLATRDENRGWSQLFDLLDQAKAYNYLKDIGCRDIRFIPRSSNKNEKTPDLQALLGASRVVCEVKKINISDEEAIARKGGKGRNIRDRLEKGFFNKLQSNITTSKDQLMAYDSSPKTRRIVYIVVNFDDILGEYKDKYFQQIDRFLSELTSEIEIVFRNPTTCFHRAISMKSAVVSNG